MAPTRDRKSDLSDPRVRRTQAALQRTLIGLVQDGDLSRISVADVAERAGVSRSTFYDHYRDVHELAEAACTTMIDDLIEAIPDPGVRDVPDDAPDTLLTFFAHLDEHAGLYRSVLGPQGSARVIDHVRRHATVAAYVGARRKAAGDGTPTDYTAQTPHDVPAAFTAGALIGVATDWLQHGCPRSPAEMADLTRPLLMAVYRGDDRPRA
ncbi:TetR/AcrR family transcriptional regulator [Nonomuraea angiospora]|uniref:TetR/AcrR family transcriptional regulator n=1 Tax=Nonomuraea angiospora TaxID=46172 RepID=UPI0029AA664D|nr:TetR/AcrR family transcriptional regulator C-terminal domain-containing protein [Nonomuraea angiospora]MDX3108268.1 TetR/AcrR family transcriptional regulator C-terminal domain-containing protein [Nonomuraea angiospora]